MTGSGTASDPYVIWDVADLQAMSADLGAYYRLGQDIEAGGVAFVPVGDAVNPFTGSFYGNNFSVRNLTIHLPATDDVGLFGCTSFASIGGAILENVSIIGNDQVGSLVGHTQGSTWVNNCIASGSVRGAAHVGGLVGGAPNPPGSTAAIRISWSRAAVDVIATGNDVGGLVGGEEWGDMYFSLGHCSASGNVTGNDYVGGLMGVCNGICTFGYATGAVTGNNHVGGLAARFTTVVKSFATGPATATFGGFGPAVAGGLCAVAGRIENAYAKGEVTAQGPVGGLAAEISDIAVNCWSCGQVSGGLFFDGGLIGSLGPGATTQNCYWDVQTSGYTTSAGPETGVNTADMVGTAIWQAADFAPTIWAYGEGDYPCLLETTPGCVPRRGGPVPPGPKVDMSVVTLPATSISEHGAVLNGQVTESLGEAVEVRFEYGLMLQYGEETPRQYGMYTGSSFRQRLFGLAEGQAYHFRAVLYGSKGVVYGQDRSFVTPSTLGEVTFITDDDLLSMEEMRP